MPSETATCLRKIHLQWLGGLAQLFESVQVIINSFYLYSILTDKKSILAEKKGLITGVLN